MLYWIRAQRLSLNLSVLKLTLVILNLDAWDEYRAGNFTGEKAAKKGWSNLINHVPGNSIMISIDKYPKSASSELEPEEIQNRIKVRDDQQT